MRTFTRTLTLGLVTALLVLVIGLFTGASSSQASVLFELPTVVFGNDVSFGGLYTTHRLMVTAAAALEVLPGMLAPGDAVLVKGSNGVGLSRVIAALAGGMA